MITRKESDYVKRFSPTGQIEIRRLGPVIRRSRMGRVTESRTETFVAMARTQTDADELIARDKLFLELRALRMRTPVDRIFWSLATARLRGAPIKAHAKYDLKRRCLGRRLKDAVDPRQLSLLASSE